MRYILSAIIELYMSINAQASDTINNNFQRVGSISNAHVGSQFEQLTLKYFKEKGFNLQKKFPVKIGTAQNNLKKHNFDLGSYDKKIIVECKSHTWTNSSKVPSAKMTTWDQVMYYFSLSPAEYKKILFVQKDIRKTTHESLVQYYVRTHGYLIPNDVQIWEYDIQNNLVNIISANTSKIVQN